MALHWDTTKIDDEKVWYEVSQETLDKEVERKKKHFHIRHGPNFLLLKL